MQTMKRYAIYYAPDAGAFADFAADWLGWDAVAGVERPHPAIEGLPRALSEITAAPRKYGFHGTVKAPFHLAEGTTAADLHAALADNCTRLAPVTMPGLALHRLGGFIAVTPLGDTGALRDLAAEVVIRHDRFRAAPTPAEVARRMPDRLTPTQRTHLARWGYPYVMEDFQFHLTLSGDLPEADAAMVFQCLSPLLMPLAPRPFVVDSLCLFGEAEDGRFHLLHRYALTG